MLEKDLAGLVADGLDLGLGEFQLLVGFESQQLLDDGLGVGLLLCHEQYRCQGLIFFIKAGLKYINFYSAIQIINVIIEMSIDQFLFSCMISYVYDVFFVREF